jgi:hypothetical protein
VIKYIFKLRRSSHSLDNNGIDGAFNPNHPICQVSCTFERNLTCMHTLRSTRRLSSTSFIRLLSMKSLPSQPSPRQPIAPQVNHNTDRKHSQCSPVSTDPPPLPETCIITDCKETQASSFQPLIRAQHTTPVNLVNTSPSCFIFPYSLDSPSQLLWMHPWRDIGQ